MKLLPYDSKVVSFRIPELTEENPQPEVLFCIPFNVCDECWATVEERFWVNHMEWHKRVKTQPREPEQDGVWEYDHRKATDYLREAQIAYRKGDYCLRDRLLKRVDHHIELMKGTSS